MDFGRDPEQNITIPWLVFDLIGQYTLLLLLVTYAVARSLPQRQNPYLVNLIITTFVSSVPPVLLLYGGVQFKDAPATLCLIQACIMDAIMPMVFVAQLALVFDNWSELRSLALHKRQISRNKVVQWTLFISPYLVFIIFLIASSVAAVQDPHNTQPRGIIAFAYCRNGGAASAIVKGAVGIFLGILSVVHLVLEVWVIWIIYAYPMKEQEDPTAWRTTIQFASRLIIFSALQFLTVLLSLINIPLNGGPMKRAYELMTSMNGLATFIAFGTQTSILLVWKGWIILAWGFVFRKGQRETSSIQPPNLPVNDWAYTPWRSVYPGSKRSSFSTDTDMSMEEKGMKPLVKKSRAAKPGFPGSLWKQ